MKTKYLFPLLLLLSACAEPTTAVLSDADVSADSGSADAGAPVLVDAGEDAEDSTVPLPSDAGDVAMDSGELEDASLQDAMAFVDSGPEEVTRESLLAQCEQWQRVGCGTSIFNCSGGVNTFVNGGEACMAHFDNYWDCYLTANDSATRDCELHTYANSVCGDFMPWCP